MGIISPSRKGRSEMDSRRCEEDRGGKKVPLPAPAPIASSPTTEMGEMHILDHDTAKVDKTFSSRRFRGADEERASPDSSGGACRELPIGEKNRASPKSKKPA